MFQKNIYFCFIDYAKAFDCVCHSKLWKILEREFLKSTLLKSIRLLYLFPEKPVCGSRRNRMGLRTTDWFKFGKLNRDYRTVKGQYSFQFQRSTMPKNVHTTA